MLCNLYALVLILNSTFEVYIIIIPIYRQVVKIKGRKTGLSFGIGWNVRIFNQAEWERKILKCQKIIQIFWYM